MIKPTFAQSVLNFAFRGEEDLYIIALDGDGEEIDETALYDGGRQLVEFGLPSIVGGKQTVTNSNIVDFEEMPDCEVSALRLYDADENGNALLDIPLVDGQGEPTPVEVIDGQTLRISVGMLAVDLS